MYIFFSPQETAYNEKAPLWVQQEPAAAAATTVTREVFLFVS